MMADWIVEAVDISGNSYFGIVPCLEYSTPDQLRLIVLKTVSTIALKLYSSNCDLEFLDIQRCLKISRTM